MEISSELLPPTTPERIALLLYPGIEPMDFQGPCGIFDLWHLEEMGPEVITVGETQDIISCAYGRQHLVQYGFDHCPHFDVLLIPGGKGWREAVKNPRLIRFVQESSTRSRFVLSVCTGVFILNAAELIRGKRVTTHWEFLDELASSPHLQVERNVKFVQDGNLFTAAGIFSGIDLALEFIRFFEGSSRPDGQLRQGEDQRIRKIAQYDGSSNCSIIDSPS